MKSNYQKSAVFIKQFYRLIQRFTQYFKFFIYKNSNSLKCSFSRMPFHTFPYRPYNNICKFCRSFNRFIFPIFHNFLCNLSRFWLFTIFVNNISNLFFRKIIDNFISAYFQITVHPHIQLCLKSVWKTSFSII